MDTGVDENGRTGQSGTSHFQSNCQNHIAKWSGVMLLLSYYNLKILEYWNKLEVQRSYNMKITVEFGGGAELLFGNKKYHEVNLPAKDKPWIIGDFLLWLKDNSLTDRPELFLQDQSVRPGILVLVNDTDWELMGTTSYVLEPNDTVVFISTLHGG